MSGQWWCPVKQYLLADCPAFDSLHTLEYQRPPTFQAGSRPGEVGGCCVVVFVVVVVVVVTMTVEVEVGVRVVGMEEGGFDGLQRYLHY